MRARRGILIVAALLLAFAAGAGLTRLLVRDGRPPAAGGEPAGAHAGHATADTATRPEAGSWYTCGMHPEVIQDHPGNCPKCGMKLQPMSADRAAALGLGAHAAEDRQGERQALYWKSTMLPGEIRSTPGKDSMGMDMVPVYADEVAQGAAIRIDPVTEQNMGVRVGDVARGPLVRTVRTVGFVDYDETTLATVTTKVNGWVEKLYVDETGVQVHTGEPLFALYSPELFSAQEEYLAARKNLQRTEVPSVPRARADSESLVRDARTRLEYFDITAEQIDHLERAGKAQKTLTIHAPFTGIVTQKNVVEGQRVMAGMDLFRIADLSTVWVIGKVFEYDLPYVHLGQEALMTLSYLPGRTFRGRVTYVYPYLEAKAREIPVRMEFHNPGYELKPGMYARITLSDEIAPDATLVPDMAVIDTGIRSVAFVETGAGRFEARQVVTGARGEDNRLQVLSGLVPGEKVVVSGQFLLDSESNLREAALKLLEPGATDAATPIETATREAEGEHAATAPASEKRYWVCPMPEHTDILYDKPGRCPLCGMELVPVTRREGHVTEPSIAYWTCPMPEHTGVVREKGPGKCPLCGMSLIPVPATEASPAPAPSPRSTGQPR